MKKYKFETETNKILELMIHSLYSNKEIFLRELISNSNDALDKLNMLSLTDETLKNNNEEFKILIDINKDENKLIIKDTGIGMTKEELIKNLGTIAKSGTKSFLENLKEKDKNNNNQIGQFGVGFYSAFMVAEKIEVKTKTIKENKSYKWTSNGTGEFEIEEIKKVDYGTEIILYLKPEELEFLSEYRIENIVKKYSNHISFPIFLNKKIEKDEKDEKIEEEFVYKQINNSISIWNTKKKDLNESDYKSFYKDFTGDYEEPLKWIHNNNEGSLEYSTLFYIPKKASPDLYRVDYKQSVKLYINKVLITEDDKEILPQYLRFLQGVIDSKDLPLNVSREVLQSNPIMNKIKKASVKKVLNELSKMMEKDPENYNLFLNEFGNCIKEGLYNDFENRDKILELLKFNSLNDENKISIKDFISTSVDSEKKEILYVTNKMNLELLKNSPSLEKFKNRNINVLLLNEEIDSLIFANLNKYKDYTFVNISEAKLEEKIIEKKEDIEEEYSDLVNKIQTIMKEEVEKVELSFELTNSPINIKEDIGNQNYSLYKMMKQVGQQIPDIEEPKPILEINPNHKIIKSLLNKERKIIEDTIKLLFDQNKLFLGIEIKDTISFAKRLNSLIEKTI